LFTSKIEPETFCNATENFPFCILNGLDKEIPSGKRNFFCVELTDKIKKIFFPEPEKAQSDATTPENSFLEQSPSMESTSAPAPNSEMNALALCESIANDAAEKTFSSEMTATEKTETRAAIKSRYSMLT